MVRECENERKERSIGERGREEPKKSVRDRLIVRESKRDRKERQGPCNSEIEREEPKKSARDRVIVRESEWDRGIARES